MIECVEICFSWWSKSGRYFWSSNLRIVDLVVLIIPRASYLIYDLIHPLLYSRFLFSSSVHCTNTREYDFYIFSSCMYLRFTYTSTSILNNMFSKSFSVVVEVVAGDVGLGVVYYSSFSIVYLASPHFLYSSTTSSVIQLVVVTYLLDFF